MLSWFSALPFPRCCQRLARVVLTGGVIGLAVACSDGGSDKAGAGSGSEVETEPVRDPQPVDVVPGIPADQVGHHATQPDPPAAVVLEYITDTALAVQWGRPADAGEVAAYEVYVDGMLADTVSRPRVSLRSLAPSRRYRISIRAVNHAGEVSAESTPLWVTTAAPGVNRGYDFYIETGCASCHGWNAQGPVRFSPWRLRSELEARISAGMPPDDPRRCRDRCAQETARWIAARFSTGRTAPLPPDLFTSLPSGAAQRQNLCRRLAETGQDHIVRDVFCGPRPPVITSLRSLQRLLGLAFTNAAATRREDNGRLGNPAFTLLGHSTSLAVRLTNAINPRAIVFTPPREGRPTPGFVVMGFVRGEPFVEIIAADRKTAELSFFLLRYERSCDAGGRCDNGDRFTGATERDWLAVTLYDDEDLKNTVLDCRHCHQPDGPGTRKILRMQELTDPWTHFFRNNRIGGIALIADYRRAHGRNEEYAGIPGPVINATDPEQLETLLRSNGFAEQPNAFDSAAIEAEVARSPGQPFSNDVPGISVTWQRIFRNALAGKAIPVPYHDVKITDSARLAVAAQSYENYLGGVLAAADLPDMSDVLLTSRLHEMGLRVVPGSTGKMIISQACSQCHHSRLDQRISRARFNVDLQAMSDLKGGVLTGRDRDLELGVAVDRLRLPDGDVRKMPPVRFRTLSRDEVERAVGYLCSQADSPLRQCSGS